VETLPCEAKRRDLRDELYVGERRVFHSAFIHPRFSRPAITTSRTIPTRITVQISRSSQEAQLAVRCDEGTFSTQPAHRDATRSPDLSSEKTFALTFLASRTDLLAPATVNSLPPAGAPATTRALSLYPRAKRA
jgi:hypothetical protein